MKSSRISRCSANAMHALCTTLKTQCKRLCMPSFAAGYPCICNIHMNSFAGDKQETAVNIAHSTNLVDDSFVKYPLGATSFDEMTASLQVVFFLLVVNLGLCCTPTYGVG